MIKNTFLYTVVIPSYNESKYIQGCLQSLVGQAIPLEIIVVDDGSTDDTLLKIKNYKKQNPQANIQVISQNHLGPGVARNLAAKNAKGDILIFVDADMTFNKNFVRKVIDPIQKGNAIGTDSQSGVLANPQNYWARCWNLGKFAAARNYSQNYLTDITPNKNDFGGVFRAIKKSEFLKVGGFESGGDYTDDVSLSRKLHKKARMVKDAVFYHWNPDTISEVWLRASWIGSGKNFTSTKRKKALNILKFFPLLAPIKGLITGFKFQYPQFIIFKIVYDTAVWLAVINSL